MYYINQDIKFLAHLQLYIIPYIAPLLQKRQFFRKLNLKMIFKATYIEALMTYPPLSKRSMTIQI